MQPIFNNSESQFSTLGPQISDLELRIPSLNLGRISKFRALCLKLDTRILHLGSRIPNLGFAS